MRRKLRCYIFKQWKTSKKRCKELQKLGAEQSWLVAYSGKGPWMLFITKQVSVALECDYFDEFGVFSLYQQWYEFVKLPLPPYAWPV